MPPVRSRISIDNLNNYTPQSTTDEGKSPRALSTSPVNQTGSQPGNDKAGNKIQHQFKSQEKITLLEQVVKHNPYQDRKHGWQKVKNGYLEWKNLHRPKYADPAEDYIKRKVQEMLRLYSRSGLDSLKENGFVNRDSPEAKLFVVLVEKVVAMKGEGEGEGEGDTKRRKLLGAAAGAAAASAASAAHAANITNATNVTADPNVTNATGPNVTNPNVTNPIHTPGSATYTSFANTTIPHSSLPSPSLPPSMGKPPPKLFSSFSTPLKSLPDPAASAASIAAAIPNHASTKIADLSVDEFMVIMNKNNQFFASTFAQEFTKSISESLCVIMSSAIKEAIQETTKNNLDIIKAMRN